MRCFCIGGGSSLEGFDFKRLDNEFTIGVNFVFKFYEPSILIWSDLDIYPKYKKEIDSLKSEKYVRDSIINAHPDQFSQMKPYKVSTIFYGREGLEKGLYGGKGTYLTGILAVSLAIALGYSPIYLLGYDGGPINNKLHFHEFSKQKDPFSNMIKDYDVFKGYAIYNCSLQSNITQFPTVNIDSVLCNSSDVLRW